jgi:3-dehydroquinate synthase
MELVTIEVRSERAPYRVLVGRGLASQAAAWLPAEAGGLVVVSCPPVWRAVGARVRRVAGPKVVLIPDGERAKKLATVGKLYEAFVRRRLDRAGVVVAVGGGVVGDVAGFAAATYLRGVRLVQVATSLLAQVDSAVGGKVGVNLPSGKNLVGAFHAPSVVVCDPEVLRTLPRREFRAGLYEVIKYGVIRSKELFERLERRPDHLDPGAADLPEIIAACCRIKADVVSEDEREAGPRRVLNFGHTIGHALEALTAYRRFRHGEAIAYGMLAAARISTRRRLLAPDDERRLQAMIAALGPLPPVADLRAGDALEIVGRDKKRVRGRLTFVLARGLGDTEMAADVSATELIAAMRAIGLKP